jgi:MoaA/NifB/PqqE/SkfB family radical SAM enzyme
LTICLKPLSISKTLYPDIKLRLNTNGLSDLINGRETAKDICKYIDVISISLNDPDSEKYDKITRNIFPGKAFDAMLKFTRDCVACGNSVRMTVVDVIPRRGYRKIPQNLRGLRR